MKWQVFESGTYGYIVDTEGYSVSPVAFPVKDAYALVRAHNRELDVAVHNAKIESSAAIRAMK